MFFVERFPDVVSLADAERKEVLSLWSGLGYNRRAVLLHKTARILVDECGASVPAMREQLLSLPGVGDYTSGAVLAFAYNHPVVIIETNIRTVVFHHYLGREGVEDAEVYFFVERMLRHALDLKIPPRTFYSAIMDYGSYLKSIGIRVNPLSQHYIKQGKFDGSVRQARGALLRAFITAEKGVSKNQMHYLGIRRVEEGLTDLVSDGLVERKGEVLLSHLTFDQLRLRRENNRHNNWSFFCFCIKIALNLSGQISLYNIKINHFSFAKVLFNRSACYHS